MSTMSYPPANGPRRSPPDGLASWSSAASSSMCARPGSSAWTWFTPSSRTSMTAATGPTSIRRCCSTTATSTGSCHWPRRCTRRTGSRRPCRCSSSGCCRRRGSTRRSASAASPSPPWNCCRTSGGCAGTWPRGASARWPPRSAVPRRTFGSSFRRTGSRSSSSRSANRAAWGCSASATEPTWTSSPNGSDPSTGIGPPGTCPVPNPSTSSSWRSSWTARRSAWRP